MTCADNLGSPRARVLMPRESQTQRAARARRIVKALARLYSPRCALTHESPWQLLVATILSAQCTDERVNQVTPALFARFRTPTDFANAAPAEIEAIIRPTGFFRAKTRHILNAAQAVVTRHRGEVPRTLEELVAINGIGRKTANVVLGTAFRIASGVVVDTHVSRLARRMKLTAQRDPIRIEADLMALLPKREWIDFSHRMIWHGRTLCLARRPRCADCPLVPDCPGSREFLSSPPVPRAGSRR